MKIAIVSLLGLFLFGIAPIFRMVPAGGDDNPSLSFG